MKKLPDIQLTSLEYTGLVDKVFDIARKYNVKILYLYNKNQDAFYEAYSRVKDKSSVCLTKKEIILDNGSCINFVHCPDSISYEDYIWLSANHRVDYVFAESDTLNNVSKFKYFITRQRDIKSFTMQHGPLSDIIFSSGYKSGAFLMDLDYNEHSALIDVLRVRESKEVLYQEYKDYLDSRVLLINGAQGALIDVFDLMYDFKEEFEA